MNPPKPFLSSLLFVVIRFIPLLSAPVFVEVSSMSFEHTSLYLDLLVRAAAILLAWNMSEGVFMLWVREKTAGSPRSRGYGIVAIILSLLVLVLLHAFRAKATQAQFLILLAVLALRGMSRSSWEQGRPQVAALTAPLSHSFLAGLSFLLIFKSFSWQAAVMSAALGLFTGAIETTWHAASFRATYPRWVQPLYRFSIVFPVVAVASLSLIGQLPPIYIMCLILLPWCTRHTWNQGKSGEISEKQFLRLTSIYLAWVGIVVAAAVYS